MTRRTRRIVEFSFEVPDDRLTVHVLVYPTLKALNEATACSDPIGAEVERYTHERGDDVWFTATMRFCRPRLGVSVIAHEAAHIAVLVHESDRPLRCDNDEPFALTVGEVARHVTLGLRDTGCIR